MKKRKFIGLGVAALLIVGALMYVSTRSTSISDELATLTTCSESDVNRLNEIKDDSSVDKEDLALANFRLTDCALRTGDIDSAKQQAEETRIQFEESGNLEGADQSKRIIEGIEQSQNFVPPPDADQEGTL